MGLPIGNQMFLQKSTDLTRLTSGKNEQLANNEYLRLVLLVHVECFLPEPLSKLYNDLTKRCCFLSSFWSGNQEFRLLAWPLDSPICIWRGYPARIFESACLVHAPHATSHTVGPSHFYSFQRSQNKPIRCRRPKCSSTDPKPNVVVQNVWESYMYKRDVLVQLKHTSMVYQFLPNVINVRVVTNGGAHFCSQSGDFSHLPDK